MVFNAHYYLLNELFIYLWVIFLQCAVFRHLFHLEQKQKPHCSPSKSYSPVFTAYKNVVFVGPYKVAFRGENHSFIHTYIHSFSSLGMSRVVVAAWGNPTVKILSSKCWDQSLQWTYSVTEWTWHSLQILLMLEVRLFFPQQLFLSPLLTAIITFHRLTTRRLQTPHVVTPVCFNLDCSSSQMTVDESNQIDLWLPQWIVQLFVATWRSSAVPINLMYL